MIDEGTSALDKENLRLIEDLFLQNQEYAVLYVSHHIDLKQLAYFDQVIQIQHQTAVSLNPDSFSPAIHPGS